MRVTPRHLVVLRPTDAFVEWLAGRTPVLGAPTREEVSEDSQVFLVPAGEDRIETERWVLRHWRTLLELQLADWVPDRRRWPRRLERALFVRWFEVEVHECVVDLTPDKAAH